MPALIAALAALTGCGDTLYYQTRYIPQSADAVYSPAEQMSWTGDKEAYELPSQPPAIDGDGEPRHNCARPYQKFKSDPTIGYKAEEVHGSRTNESIAVGGTNEMVRPDGPTTALKRPAMYATDNRPYQPGMTAPAYVNPTGELDTRPRSTTGAGTNQIWTTNMVGENDNYNPYCDPDHMQHADDHVGPKAYDPDAGKTDHAHH